MFAVHHHNNVTTTDVLTYTTPRIFHIILYGPLTAIGKYTDQTEHIHFVGK